MNDNQYFNNKSIIKYNNNFNNYLITFDTLKILQWNISSVKYNTL